LAPGVLAAAVAAIANTPRPARIAIRGRGGSGRRTLLAAFAQRANRALGIIDAAALPRDVERFAHALRTALRRAPLAGLLRVVAGPDTATSGEHAAPDAARDILAAHPGPLATIVGPTASHAAIHVAPLSETERLDVWRRTIAGTTQWLRDPAGLAARY